MPRVTAARVSVSGEGSDNTYQVPPHSDEKAQVGACGHFDLWLLFFLCNNGGGGEAGSSALASTPVIGK